MSIASQKQLLILGSTAHVSHIKFCQSFANFGSLILLQWAEKESWLPFQSDLTKQTPGHNLSRNSNPPVALSSHS
jgi:hypothetical protein